VDDSANASPVVVEVDTKQSKSNGSDLQDHAPSVTAKPSDGAAVVVDATSIVQSGGNDGSPASGSGTTGIDESNGDIGFVSVTLDALSGDADNQGDVVEYVDTVPSLSAIALESDPSGLDSPLSANGDPLAPPASAMLVGALELVRRDLDQASEVELTSDTPDVTETPLIIDPASNDSNNAALTAAAPTTVVSKPYHLTVEPTSAERTAAFQKDQVKRIEAFTEAQATRKAALEGQLASQYAESPLGALVASAAYVVSELANTAAFVVTEFVNYISFAITEFVHGLQDWFTAPAEFTGLYGEPTLSEQYFRAQSAQNCVLMATAMVIGQLTGTSPTEQEIAEEAGNTPSVVNEGRPMYSGLQTQDGVDVKDAIKLLDMHGISATLTSYGKNEGNLALRAVAIALQQNKAVSVGLHGGTIWNAVENKPLPEGVSASDHQVVVTGIDFDKGIVHLNDSGFGENEQGVNGGINMKVPLDAFMKAWQTDDFETIVAQLKPANTGTSGPASTRISGSDNLFLVDVA
jgi:hypothetical protein